jgi:outer membrane protein OmpA-like peptidoglycan-associated protein
MLADDPRGATLLQEIARELGLPADDTVTSRDLDELVGALERAFEHGDLVVDRGERAPAMTWAAPEPPPAPAPAPASRPDEATHNFIVRWVDEVGQGIPGVALAISHTDVEDATSDGSGIARVDGSTASSASAEVTDPSSVRDGVRSRWDSVRDRRWLTEDDGVTVVQLGRGELPMLDLPPDKMRVVSVQPYVVRVRLVGAFFDTNKCFLLPGGIDGVKGLVAAYARHDPSKLLLVGHTDTTGSTAYNDSLSLERAESLKAYLTSDVDGWLAWYGSEKPQAKRWGGPEDRFMIAALPDAGEREDDETPVKWFQRTRGLDVDGIAGPKTRRALVGEYMALEGTTLPSGITPVAHGCGENFPEEASGDDVESLPNRHVEAFFFDDDLGIQPPPKGKNSAAGSAEYPEWVRRAKETEDHEAEHPSVDYTLRLKNEDGLPIPEAAYIAVLADGTERSGQLDRKGVAVLEDVPVGTVLVRYPDDDDLLAKSLAASARQAFPQHDPQPLYDALTQSPATVQQMVQAYDTYFNDYGGGGFIDDLYNELGSTEARHVISWLLATAGLTPRDPLVVQTPRDPGDT